MGESGKREEALPRLRFELTGGAICLDFANTLEGRGDPEPRELLTSREALIEWGLQSKLFSKGEAARMRRAGPPAPANEEKDLERARALREAIFKVFSASAARKEPPREAVRRLNLELPEALARLRLAPGPVSFTWRWEEPPSPASRIIARVADSAAELLTSAELARVRECDAPACRWLFIDTSRNRSRRWCDMSVCGNRAKARRHYLRTRERPRRNKSREGAV